MHFRSSAALALTALLACCCCGLLVGGHVTPTETESTNFVVVESESRLNVTVANTTSIVMKESEPTSGFDEDAAKAMLPITYLLDHLSPQTLKTTIVNAVRGQASWMTCMLCSTSVSLIRLFPEVATVQTIFTQICSRFNYEDYRVCTGIADLYGEEFIYILKNSKLYTNEICGLVINPSCMSSSSDFPSGKEWVFPGLELSPRIQRRLSALKVAENRRVKQTSLIATDSSPQNVSTILHLSDLHLDQKYQVNTFAYCSEPLCCRSSSVPSAKSVRAGFWGSFGNCDSNIHNIESLFTTVTAEPFKSQYKYVIFTGDYIAHDVWLTTKEEIVETTRKLNGEFKRRMPANKIVIPVIGNHEGHPVDQFCPPDIEAKQFHMDWLYNELLDQWRDWIPESQHALFAKYGYYSLMDGKARWVVLNMNYCNRLNFWVAYDYKELGGMLKWFEQELQEAVTAGQYVYITGHIAPDPQDCIDNWIAAYQKIIEKYAPIIKGQFFGHTHFDEIRLYYNAEEKPTGVAYLAPSVTTFGDVHPSFRLYNTDPSTGDIVDHRTFFLNITEANHQHLMAGPFRDVQPSWNLLYSARDTYNLSSLSVDAWHQFTSDAEHTPSLVRSYYRNYGRYDSKVMEHTQYETMLNSLIDRIKIKSK